MEIKFKETDKWVEVKRMFVRINKAIFLLYEKEGDLQIDFLEEKDENTK